jgi:hypothetical protein
MEYALNSHTEYHGALMALYPQISNVYRRLRQAYNDGLLTYLEFHELYASY